MGLAQIVNSVKYELSKLFITPEEVRRYFHSAALAASVDDRLIHEKDRSMVHDIVNYFNNQNCRIEVDKEAVHNYVSGHAGTYHTLDLVVIPATLEDKERVWEGIRSSPVYLQHPTGGIITPVETRPAFVQAIKHVDSDGLDYVATFKTHHTHRIRVTIKDPVYIPELMPGMNIFDRQVF